LRTILEGTLKRLKNYLAESARITIIGRVKTQSFAFSSMED